MIILACALAAFAASSLFALVCARFIARGRRVGLRDLPSVSGVRSKVELSEEEKEMEG